MANDTPHAPLFSIILPTRDRPAMLDRAVASVLGQLHRDFELIVIDDGSKDPCHVGTADARIRVIRNHSSVGVAQARNIGISAARGAYISFLDDDDEFLSSFLASTFERLKDSREGVGLSWCGVKTIDDSRDDGGRERDFAPHQNLHAAMEDLITVGISWGMTVKAGCLKKLGPFNSELKVASDTDFFFRFLAGDFVPVVVSGVHVVRHDHGKGRLTDNAFHRERIRICEEWFLVQYAGFLDQHPVFRDGLLGYVEFLKREMSGETTEKGVNPINFPVE